MTTENDDYSTFDHRDFNSVGGLLREARLVAGYDLPGTARALRIREVYLRAIENDDYASLPGKTYVLGFLRSYAEFLGLDGDDVVARYRRQLDDAALPHAALSFPARESDSMLPRAAILVLSLLLAVGAIYGGATFFSDDGVKTVDRVAPVPERLLAEGRSPQPTSRFTPRNDPSSAFAAVTPQPSEAGAGNSVLTQPSPGMIAAPAPGSIALPPSPDGPRPVQVAEAPAAPLPLPKRQADTVPPPKPAAPARPEPAAAPAAAGTPAAAAGAPSRAPGPAPQQTQTAALPSQEAPPKRREIVVVARVDSWIEVRDGRNSALASLLLRVGDSYRVPEGADFRLVTGDVRGLEVRVDGVAVRQRGTDDNKAHRVLSLDADRLQAGNAVID